VRCGRKAWFAWPLSYSVHTPPSVTAARGESRGQHRSLPAVGKVIQIRGQASGRAVPPDRKPLWRWQFSRGRSKRNSRFFTECYIRQSHPVGRTPDGRAALARSRSIPAKADSGRRLAFEKIGRIMRRSKELRPNRRSPRRFPVPQAGERRGWCHEFSSPAGAGRPGCRADRLPRSYAQAAAPGAPVQPPAAAPGRMPAEPDAEHIPRPAQARGRRALP